MPTPTATADQRPQHLQALERANAIRLQQSATKRTLGVAATTQDSRELCAQLLMAPPPHVATMTIFAILKACRGMGRARAQQMLHRHQISELRIVGKLTDRQLRLLANELRGGFHIQEQLIA